MDAVKRSRVLQMLVQVLSTYRTVIKVLHQYHQFAFAIGSRAVGVGAVGVGAAVVVIVLWTLRREGL